jgi:transcriptional regulator with XRE-family HTH domain
MKTPTKFYTTDDIIVELKSKQGVRTQTEFAEEIGITQGFLNKVYSGVRNPDIKILDYLSLVEVGPLYQRKGR